MSGQTIPSPHGPVTIAGQILQHVWSTWMAHARASQWRRCVIPGCNETERREVKI